MSGLVVRYNSAMLETQTLNALLLEAFTGQTTWLEASTRHALDDFIEAFHTTRAVMQRTLEGLRSAHAAFASPAHPIWSISETVTHLIYSQGFYHNKLLDIATSQLPHVVEAARGFGEGAVPNVPADELRARLAHATEQITVVLEATRHSHDPHRVEQSPLFGSCTYKTWVLLLLGHEVDHVRQARAMRRLALAEAG
jgi:hypothetical protein